MNEGLRVEVVALAGMARLLEAWQALADRCLEANIFSEPAFAMAAALHLAPPPGPSFVLAWRDRDRAAPRLVGLCIVTRSRLRSRAAAFSHPQATAAFPVLDRDDAAAALQSLLEAIAGSAGHPAALLLQGVPAEGPTATLIRSSLPQTRTMEARTRAVLRPGGSPVKVGKEMRRQGRRMGELGSVHMNAAIDQDDIGAARAAFLDLEAQGWKGRSGTALGQTEATRAFVTAALDSLAAQGRCRVESLRVDDRLVAAAIVLHGPGQAWFWKIAYDEALGRFSPGVQLTVALSGTLLDDPSLKLVDSCAVAGHAMIDRLWPDRITVVDLLVPTVSYRRLAYGSAAAIEIVYRLGRECLKRVHNRLRSARRSGTRTARNTAKR